MSRSQLLASPLTTDGIGPLSVGMTPAQVSRALGRTVKPEYLEPTRDCGTVSPYGDAQDGELVLMFSKDRLVRVSTYSGEIDTPSGFHIGSSETAVRKAFPQLLIDEHTYVPGGYYLTFVAVSDPQKRLVFETDGERVEAMHGGRAPYVNYVEGCL